MSTRHSAKIVKLWKRKLTEVDLLKVAKRIPELGLTLNLKDTTGPLLDLEEMQYLINIR